MNIDETKNILRRKGDIFQTGGFKPTNEIGESLIGTVKWKKAEDEIPGWRYRSGFCKPSIIRGR